MTTLKAKVSGSWVTIGGAGVGVPPGGATNAILTKASAADYGTAWTTAPTLTALTMTGDITLANNLFVRGALTGGGSTPVIGLASDDNVYVANALGAGRTIQIGGSGATVTLGNPATTIGDLTVGNNLTVTGTLVSKHAVRAAALVNPNGTFTNQFGFSNLAKLGTGYWQLTLATGLNGPIITATVNSSVPSPVVVALNSSTQVSVYTFNASNVAADVYFHVMVVSP